MKRWDTRNMEFEPDPPPFARDKPLTMINTRVCACCKNPLVVNVYVKLSEYPTFVKYYAFYTNAKEVPVMMLNREMWHKGRIICLACKMNSAKPLDLLRDRELGRRRKFWKSWTIHEIHQWFRDFEKFYTRPDNPIEEVPEFESIFMPHPIKLNLIL